MRGRFPFLTAGRVVQVSRFKLVVATVVAALHSLTLTLRPATDAMPAVELASRAPPPHAPYNGWLRTVPALAADEPLDAP